MQIEITTETTRPARPLLAAEDLAEAGVREAKRALCDAITALPHATDRAYAERIVQLRTRELSRRRAALLNLRAMSGRIELDAGHDLSDLD